MNRRAALSIGIITLFLALCTCSYADSLDKMQIVKISARDKRAIVKMDDATLRIIKVGEEIPIRPDEAITSDAEAHIQGPGDQPASPGDQKTIAGISKENKTMKKTKSAKNKRDKELTAKKDVKDGPVKKDSNASRKAAVIDISAGRIVLEETTKTGVETIILRLEEPTERPGSKVRGVAASDLTDKDKTQPIQSKTIVERIRRQPDQHVPAIAVNRSVLNIDQKAVTGNSRAPETEQSQNRQPEQK